MGVELYKRRSIRGLGLNNGDLYAYAGNNPVKYTDPDGRENGTPYSLKLGIPYDAEKKLIDREYKAWLSQFSLSNRTERTITPFPEQNIKLHDAVRSQYKDPKLMLYHSVTDVGLIEVDATALRFGGEMDTKFFLGFYADIMDNHLHFYNNDEKKGVDYKFSLASISLVAGIRGNETVRRLSLSPNIGISGRYYHGKQNVGLSLNTISSIAKNSKFLNLIDYEETPNNE